MAALSGLEGQLVGHLEGLAKRQDDFIRQVLVGGVQRDAKTRLQTVFGGFFSDPRGCGFGTDHVKSSEDVAVVVTGLEIFGDVGKRRQILRILSRARDVTDLVFRYDVLRRQKRPLILSTKQI